MIKFNFLRARRGYQHMYMFMTSFILIDWRSESLVVTPEKVLLPTVAQINQDTEDFRSPGRYFARKEAETSLTKFLTIDPKLSILHVISLTPYLAT